MEKTSAEENLTKTINEKEMLLKELIAKNDSLSQLETMIEQLQGNQPDSVKLLAAMESDKIAAARAVQQNKELKEQLESMQEVFMKLVCIFCLKNYDNYDSCNYRFDNDIFCQRQAIFFF